jgi:hypothetical protein
VQNQRGTFLTTEAEQASLVHIPHGESSTFTCCSSQKETINLNVKITRQLTTHTRINPEVSNHARSVDVNRRFITVFVYCHLPIRAREPDIEYFSQVSREVGCASPLMLGLPLPSCHNQSDVVNCQGSRTAVLKPMGLRI